MRRVAATYRDESGRSVMRVTSVGELPSGWRPELSWLVTAENYEELHALERITKAGITGIRVHVTNKRLAELTFLPAIVTRPMVLKPGDVVAATPPTRLQILYRESDAHHTIFLTNRCNSYCLMCSQPPTAHDDSWLIEEAKLVALHIRHSPAVLGFTGGEPLLLRERLREVLDTFGAHHPYTQFEILTNGRLFSDQALARHLLHKLELKVSWAVPLYGHADFLHDYVVQSEGAFNETIGGLLTLHAYAQPIQLRIVLIKPTLQILSHLCAFVARNLPFVGEVALMGCEPVGFALANREVCEVDTGDREEELSEAVRQLRRAGIPPVLMNLPMCALPLNLRSFAHRSISDWKHVFAPECGSCIAIKECCGLFASYEQGWGPTKLRPIREVARHETV